MNWYRKASYEWQIEELIPKDQLEVYHSIKAKFREKMRLYADLFKKGGDEESKDRAWSVLQEAKVLDKQIVEMEKGPKAILDKRHQEAIDRQKKQEALTRRRFTTVKKIGPKLEELARKHFPLTEDIHLCGHILSNGDMLAFSYHGNQRDIDHRQVGEAFPENLPIDSGTDGMRQFMIATGAIRVNSSRDLRFISFDLETLPTPSQKRVMRRYMESGNYSIEMTYKRGKVDPMEYVY